MENLNEKKELIIQSYQKSFDKNVAYMKVGLTDQEIQLLDQDKDFQARLGYVLADQKEKIITRLIDLRNLADKDEVSLKATIKLGEILYSEVFGSEDDKSTKLILPLETQKKLKDVFTSGTLDDWKQKIKERLLNDNDDPNKIIDQIVN
jgi:hypothetical protein